jgi:pyruvate formate lyase activating enzyme
MVWAGTRHHQSSPRNIGTGWKTAGFSSTFCPRLCQLKDGQRGLCFVRARRHETIVLTTYGRSSGFCIDPIEKKPLNHFLPGTPVLSFGTAGCNLACNFCQNWDTSKSREMDTLADAASPETIGLTAAELGCRSVAFTYNDPTIFHEYAIDVAQACAEYGIKSVAVTAGYVCEEPRAEFYRYMDAAKRRSQRIYRTILSTCMWGESPAGVRDPGLSEASHERLARDYYVTHSWRK